MSTTKWMQNAFGNRKGKLHKNLEIPTSQSLEHAKSLLEVIEGSKIGDTIKNPLTIGKRNYKITKTLKEEAVVALTAIKIGDKNRKEKAN